MEHQTQKNGIRKKRVGFHYYPDTLHYSEREARLWPKIFEKYGINWLVIQSPLNRAVPENFIRAFTDRKIQILVDFRMPNDFNEETSDLETLLEAYGRWGVRYALLNSNPNCRNAWPDNLWSHPKLVEKHAERFLKFSEITLSCNIHPVFPTLLPGGDYWDLAFLQKSFQFIHAHASDRVKGNLVLSSFGWHFGKGLDWGAGGSKIWKSPKPYQAESAGQNHLSFRNHEWYADIIEKIFHRIPPIILLESGIVSHPQKNGLKDIQADIEKQRQIYQLCQNENVFVEADSGRLIHPLLSQVIANIFYILTSDSEEYASFNWFTEDGERLLSAQSVFLEVTESLETQNLEKQISKEKVTEIDEKVLTFKNKRYILFNEIYRESLHHFLEKLHPYLEKFRPLIGFSREEAAESAYVIALEPGGRMEAERFAYFQRSGNILKTISPEDIPLLNREVENAG